MTEIYKSVTFFLNASVKSCSLETISIVHLVSAAPGYPRGCAAGAQLYTDSCSTVEVGTDSRSFIVISSGPRPSFSFYHQIWTVPLLTQQHYHPPTSFLEPQIQVPTLVYPFLPPNQALFRPPVKYLPPGYRPR